MDITPMTTNCIIAVLLSCLALLNGCSRPDLLVPGLTLPPGAKVMDYSELDTHGEPVTAVSVLFNCSSGWDAVVDHITGCMQRAGISEATDPNKIGLGDQDINDIQHSYGSPGDGFYVTLSNNSALMSTDDPNSMFHGEDFKEIGAYQLIVTQYK
jgi:hypothetical protein